MPQRINFAKIVTVLAVAFGVGLGLCGLSFVLASSGFRSNEEFGVDSLGVAPVSLVVMILSAFGLAIAVIAWVLAAIFGSSSSGGGGSEPRRLFDDKDDGDKPE